MADEGPNNPGTAADDDAVGTLAWGSPDNIKSSDNNYALAGGTTGITHYLKATNFSFSIPGGSTIDGIKVEIERQGAGIPGRGTAHDEEVKIVLADDSIGTENKADTSTQWPDNSDATAVYGDVDDLWSEDWGAADINNSNFGVVLSVDYVFNGPQPYNASVDHIKITVYYTEATGTNAQINIGDAWKAIEAAQINIGDAWKAVAGMQVNIGDAWKTIF